MTWVECDYNGACKAQAGNRKVEGKRKPDDSWFEINDSLCLWPVHYGPFFRFRYKSESEVRKSRPDLMPPRALQLAGEVLAFGETKYPDAEWKRMTADDHIAASLRHLLEHLAGNHHDSESTKLHLTHSFVRLGMALERYVDQ